MLGPRQISHRHIQPIATLLSHFLVVHGGHDNKRYCLRKRKASQRVYARNGLIKWHTLACMVYHIVYHDVLSPIYIGTRDQMWQDNTL